MQRIEIDDAAVRSELERLIERNTDFAPFMRNAAGFVHDRVEENFAQEGRPKWAALRPSTVERRGSSHPILQRTGSLASSITQAHDATSATVGTNKIYAKTHQFGAKKGEYSVLSTKSGASRPIPWGDIPARPFLVLAEDDVGDLREMMIDYEKRESS